MLAMLALLRSARPLMPKQAVRCLARRPVKKRPTISMALCAAASRASILVSRVATPATRERGAVTHTSHRRGRPGAQKREQVILPPLNEKIIQPLLRVVVDRGEADDEVLGIITRDEALERAREEGVDLVMIAEKSDPPVCKIVDYGKLRYQKDKKKKEQAKKAKTNEIKEVKMSYKIGEGDYDVRKKRADKFIKNGNRVKLSIQFRGREQQHMSLGDDLIARFIDDLEEAGANIAKTKTIREGRDLTTILSQKS